MNKPLITHVGGVDNHPESVRLFIRLSRNRDDATLFRALVREAENEGLEAILTALLDNISCSDWENAFGDLTVPNLTNKGE